MSDPFLSELKIVSFNFPPKGWAMCNGQLLPINQNQALFSLLGTTFGGNGQTNFALPDFRSRSPVHVGNGHILGESGGQESHTLTLSEMPAHTHFVQCNPVTGGFPTPPAKTWASNAENPYSSTSNAAMNPASIGNVGGSQPHPNMSPYIVLTFIIALQGIFPSPN